MFVHYLCRTHHIYQFLFGMFFLVSSLIFAISLHLGFVGFIKFLLWVIFVDCIGVGLVIAGLLWYLLHQLHKIYRYEVTSCNEFYLYIIPDD